MLAVGFLSLLSLGFIDMATDDDATVIDEDENDLQEPSSSSLCSSAISPGVALPKGMPHS